MPRARSKTTPSPRCSATQIGVSSWMHSVTPSLTHVNWPRHVLHGSPHRMNILTRDGAPVFIDLETIQIGPIEWDLADLEPEVATRISGGPRR